MKNFVMTAGALALFAGLAQAQETAYGFNSAGQLVTFSTATPTVVTPLAPISGILAGQTLRGVDFRPATGTLYGLSVGANDAAQVYTFDLLTGVASPVGAGLTLTGVGTSGVSIDFNPAVDRLRVNTRNGLSYRINQLTGALVQQDTSLVYDPSAGLSGTPSISGIAYSNNVAGAPGGTTLYAYEYANDRLTTIGGINGTPSPNLGQVFNVGSTGIIALGGDTSFDISGATGIGYAGAGNSAGIFSLYTVNLATGTHTLVAPFGSTVIDFSIIPTPSSLALLGLGGLVVGRRRR